MRAVRAIAELKSSWAIVTLNVALERGKSFAALSCIARTHLRGNVVTMRDVQ